PRPRLAVDRPAQGHRGQRPRDQARRQQPPARRGGARPRLRGDRRRARRGAALRAGGRRLRRRQVAAGDARRRGGHGSGPLAGCAQSDRSPDEREREAMKHADAQVLLELFANQPLAIVPDRLTTLRALVRDAEAVTEEEVRAALGAATSRGARDAPAGVAVIPIIGTIVPRASEYQERRFGVDSAERIRGELAAAVADKPVKHIVLHMDTPGGNVAGTPELARAVFEARGVKPVTAV